MEVHIYKTNARQLQDTWETTGRQMEDAWRQLETETNQNCGRQLEDNFQTTSGKHLADKWENISGREVENNRLGDNTCETTSGRQLGDKWKTSGQLDNKHIGETFGHWNLVFWWSSSSPQFCSSCLPGVLQLVFHLSPNGGTDTVSITRLPVLSQLLPPCRTV